MAAEHGVVPFCAWSPGRVVDSFDATKESDMTVPDDIEAEILRYHYVEKWRKNTIADQLGIHHSVVERVLIQHGVSAEQMRVRPSMIDKFVPFIKATLSEFPDLPAQRLYYMVKERGYPGSPSHFRHMVVCYRPPTSESAYLRLSTLPGEQAQVDWASFGKIKIGNTERKLYAFVMVLSWSRHVFLKFYLNQGTANFQRGHIDAFEFFGGCPEILVPDNITTGVKTPCRYEPIMTRSYEEMASYYGVVIIPARVRKPRDKAIVEKHVQMVEQRILAALRDRTFVGLNECNQAIWELLEDLNNRPFQKMPGSRRQMFADLDAPAMFPLPAERYEYAEWTKARLGFNYHLCADHSYYSAPYALIHKELHVRLSQKVVEIFHGSERVASHLRSYIAGHYETEPSHMPSNHREYAEWNPDRIVRWAGSTGPNTAKAVHLILNRHVHPEQAFKSCMGVISLGKKYGPDRLESACARAVSFGCPTYRSLKSILQTKLDTAQLPAAEQDRQIPDHSNIRGAGYYQQALALYDIER